MTTPTYAPTKYSLTDADFLIAKVNRNGQPQMEAFSTAITAAAASDVVVGLVPFQKGAQFLPGASWVHVSDLDTDSDLTLDFGYVYDDNVTYTNDPDAFASQVTTGQAGGLVTFDEEEALTWTAEANGWIVMVIGIGGSSYTTGVVKGQAVLQYGA